MAYVKPTATELKFAYRLLLYLHANLQNSYLLLAIVAWTRSESGRNWIGNNPLNIRNSQFATGYRQTKSNGHFALFASVDAAAKATAYFLVHNKGNGYDKMILAATRNGGEKDYAKQGIDFLLALVVSKWDAGHYGLTKTEMLDPKNLYSTTLYKVWSGLLGHKVTLPADVVPTKPAAKPPPKPHQPRTLKHEYPQHDYLQPYAAEGFYLARHKAPTVAPGDPER